MSLFGRPKFALFVGASVQIELDSASEIVDLGRVALCRRPVDPSALAMTSFASRSSADEPSPVAATPGDASDGTATDPPATTDTLPPASVQTAAAGKTPPYGTAYPVTPETDFSRPRKAISGSANSDFSLLNDLERLIKGTYIDPRTGKARSATSKHANIVYLSISRMENSHRVGRTLIAAA